MTITELIAILSRHDGDMTVLVDGYEFGFSDLHEKHIRQMRFFENQNTESFAGEHEEDAEGDRVGIVLGRGADISAPIWPK